MTQYGSIRGSMLLFGDRAGASTSKSILGRSRTTNNFSTKETANGRRPEPHEI